MTKEQLLASLKPLEWHNEELLHVPYADTPIASYRIIEDIYGNYELIGNIYLNLLGFTIDKQNNLIDLQISAQQHYNNLILNLFNLEE